MWKDEEPEEYRMQQEELAARDARCSAYAAYAAARKEEDEDEPEPGHHRRRKKNGEQVDEDDPLHALGRIVKVAGKTLWKRVSNKDVAAAAAAAAISMPNSKADSKEQEDSNTESPTSTKACSPLTLRPILGSITSNLTSNVDDHHAEEEGTVWEEEIGCCFPLDVSQTETIIEGRVYSRSTSKVQAMSNSPPPSPSVSNSKKVLTRSRSTKKVPPLFKVKQGS